MGAPGVGITPYAAVQTQTFWTPTYSEVDANGGGFGLTYNARSATDERAAARVAKDAALGSAGRLSPVIYCAAVSM